MTNLNRVIFGIATLLITSSSPFNLYASDVTTIDYSLRLIPLPCSDERSSKYLNEYCVLQRVNMADTLENCEIKRDGILVRDEARNLYICVKAKPINTDIALSFEPF